MNKKWQRVRKRMQATIFTENFNIIYFRCGITNILFFCSCINLFQNNFSINRLCTENLPPSQWTSTCPYKIKVIDRVGDDNWDNSSNYKATTLRFSEKCFSQFFACFYIWLHVSYAGQKLYQRYIFQFISIDLVAGTETKPRLSGNKPYQKLIYENGWSNLSENLRIVAIKLLELTQFASIDISIYFNFVWCLAPLWFWHF